MMVTKTCRVEKTLLTLGMLLVSGLTVSQVQTDQLTDIKAAGVVKVATFDANPPFDSIGAKTHKIVGYDVDFAKVLAKSLGVGLELITANPTSHIPLLQSGKTDLIVTDITITPGRAQVMNFSIPYFATGQQPLISTKSPDELDECSKTRIGAVKGTTGEQALYQRFPQLYAVAHDSIPPVLIAPRSGSIQAIIQDSTILAGLLGGAPDRADFRILPDLLNKEETGVGMEKGGPALLRIANDEFLKLEPTGQAARIYDVRFDPEVKNP